MGTRTGPADDLVSPVRRGLVQVLHQGVVPPQPHPVDHPPLVSLRLCIVLFVRVLEHVGRVVREGVSPRRGLRTTGKLRRRAVGRRRQDRTIGIENIRPRVRCPTVCGERVDERLRSKGERGANRVARPRARGRGQAGDGGYGKARVLWGCLGHVPHRILRRWVEGAS